MCRLSLSKGLRLLNSLEWICSSILLNLLLSLWSWKQLDVIAINTKLIVLKMKFLQNILHRYSTIAKEYYLTIYLKNDQNVTYPHFPRQLDSQLPLRYYFLLSPPPPLSPPASVALVHLSILYIGNYFQLIE